MIDHHVPADALGAARERLVRDLPARATLGLATQPLLVAAMLETAGASTVAAAGIAADLCGAGPLEALLADGRVTEIMVSGTDTVHVEVDGCLAATDVRFRDGHHLRAVIERLVAAAGRRIDDATPTVDAVLPDGTRLNAVLPPVAVGGPHLTLRRPAARRVTLGDLVAAGSVPRTLAAFLHAAVIGRCNILVSGGAGAGKTTLLAALGALVPHDQRIVSIEDVAELRLDHPHVAAQQCRDSGAGALAVIDLRALVRNSLRMRPDRIVVGEVRGAEAADMIAAMNTGHPGSMSTVHANSAVDALARIESMLALAWPALSVLTLRTWVTGTIDVVLHCERDGEGRRSVTEVAAITDAGPEVVFDGDQMRRPPRRCLDRMAKHGVAFTPVLPARSHVA